jgi:putative intracellular protease/amidase
MNTKEDAMDLNGKKIAILATNGFEQAELEVPRDRLRKAGATTSFHWPMARLRAGTKRIGAGR